jgi:hypothetical protein
MGIISSKFIFALSCPQWLAQSNQMTLRHPTLASIVMMLMQLGGWIQL